MIDQIFTALLPLLKIGVILYFIYVAVVFIAVVGVFIFIVKTTRDIRKNKF